VTKETDDYIIVLFDGVCNLCNGAVQYIIKRDMHDKFRFASLQSDRAKQITANFSRSAANLKSIFVIHKGQLYDRSDAALIIARNLNGLRWLARMLAVVPRALRNSVYDLIARTRYSIFGKRNSCMVPTPEIMHKFLP
jgi:predicted DCC family thiol-disulfide oxidoreductase YuxK